MVSRHWLYFGGFVVTGVLLVGAGLIGLVEGLSALSGGVPASEELALLTVLGAAAEWVAAVLVLGLVAASFLGATVVSVLRRASLPRDDRLVSVVEWLERRYPALRRFDAAAKVEPTSEHRQRRLRERYVDGEIGEAEFEREMERLMDDGAPGGGPRSEAEATTVETDDGPR